jgi:hypothetical protein
MSFISSMLQFYGIAQVLLVNCRPLEKLQCWIIVPVNCLFCLSWCLGWWEAVCSAASESVQELSETRYPVLRPQGKLRRPPDRKAGRLKTGPQVHRWARSVCVYMYL